MPELPEIEILARGLRKTIVGKTIQAINVLEKKQFSAKGGSASGRKGTPNQIKKYVTGATVTSISRRAKWLVIDLSTNYHFVIHLKMTGQLLYQESTGRVRRSASRTGSSDAVFLGGHSMSGPEPKYPNSHTRVIFEFNDKSLLFFQDMRKFGYVELYSNLELEEYFDTKKLGKEPIANDYTFKYFETQLKRRTNTTIKAALLDQSTMAGIGNIYADDSLFMSKINPSRKVHTLTTQEQRVLFKNTTKVLQQAIGAGGTSFSHYHQLDGTLGQYWKKRKVYQRTGEPCIRCKTPIEKTRVAGRGTHYCPTCQV